MKFKVFNAFAYRGPILAAAIYLAGQPLFASIEPVSPINGETVALLPSAQRELFSLSSYSSRVERLKGKWIGKNAKESEGQWGKSLPLVLRWRVTEDESGPWKILI